MLYRYPQFNCARSLCSNQTVAASSEGQAAAEAKKPDVSLQGNGEKAENVKQGDEKQQEEQKTTEGTEVTQKTSSEALVDTPACIAAQP